MNAPNVGRPRKPDAKVNQTFRLSPTSLDHLRYFAEFHHMSITQSLEIILEREYDHVRSYAAVERLAQAAGVTMTDRLFDYVRYRDRHVVMRGGMHDGDAIKELQGFISDWVNAGGNP